MSENEPPQLGVHRIVMPCVRCHGAGWCWCDELDNRAGHDPHALVVDDTRYSCPDCDGEGVPYSEREPFACKVCGNVPDGTGQIEHGRGCFVVDSDGGGFSFVNWAVKA